MVVNLFYLLIEEVYSFTEKNAIQHGVGYDHIPSYAASYQRLLWLLQSLEGISMILVDNMLLKSIIIHFSRATLWSYARSLSRILNSEVLTDNGSLFK